MDAACLAPDLLYGERRPSGDARLALNPMTQPLSRPGDLAD